MSLDGIMSSVRKKYNMHTISKLILVCIGIGHLTLGIYTVVHLIDEQNAAAPIKAALAKHGDKGYKESNSQVKGVFMPFFVALFCLVAAVLPYNGVLYFLFILILMEIGGFIWELVAVHKINEHQEGHYALVIQVADEVRKKATTPKRKKRFIAGIFAAVSGALPFLGKIKEYIGPAIKFIENIGGSVLKIISRVFGSNEEAAKVVETIKEDSSILNSYATLAECLELSKLLAEIGLGASIVTAVLVLAMLVFYTWEYRRSQSMMTLQHQSADTFSPAPHHSRPSPRRPSPHRPSPHHSRPSSNNTDTYSPTRRAYP